ncbi:hypothetical protein B0J14DRAFT_609642 [Halenospora varia]|nr:hypothetical protein B0J14DRAFT_609642 [Halenospora varia]
MAIAKLFGTLKGQLKDIVDYASDHYKKAGGRPLRLAVNGNSWLSTQCSPSFVRVLRAKSGPHVNPVECNILFFTCRILHLGIELYFVFDNPEYIHGGHEAHPDCCVSSTLLREVLTQAGVPWHEAPGEAEAECARMEIAKIVDGVWSEDGRALAFGCSMLVQSYREERSTAARDTKAKSHAEFRLYETKDVLKRYPGMDQNGFILAELLSGNEPADPPILSPKQILNAAAKGLGSSLRASLSSEQDFQNWIKLDLLAFLDLNGIDAVEPSLLGSWKRIQACLEPVISDATAFSGVCWNENPDVDEQKLFELVVNKFQWTLSQYVRFIVPIRIVRSLLSTEEGHQSQHDHLKLETKIPKNNIIPKRPKVTYLMSKATSLETISLYRDDDRDTFETLLCILRKANFNGQSSLQRSFAMTPPTTGKKNSTSSALRPDVTGIPLDYTSRRIPDTPHSMTRIENGEGSSNRGMRAESPPSPTPASRKRKLPWSSAKAPKKGKKASQAAPTQTAQPSSSRKGKEKEAVHHQQTPQNSPSPRSTEDVFDNDIYDDHDVRPTMATQRPSLGSPIRTIGHTSHDPITIDEDSDDDNYGSFPSVADLPATLPEPGPEEVENSPTDDAGGSSGTEYGSLPPSPDLRDLP